VVPRRPAIVPRHEWTAVAGRAGAPVGMQQAPVTEEVLCMNFQQVDLAGIRNQRVDMLRLEADSGASSQGAC